MTAFERFAVVRVPFPFTDRQAQERRPALMLSLPDFQQGCGHVLLAMITSARQSAWPLDWLTPAADLLHGDETVVYADAGWLPGN